MKFYTCSRESELLTALREQRWPDACEPELRAHVATCSQCSDLVLVAPMMQQAHDDASRQAQLPPSGVLWWRAQVQRRNGAIERVSKPIVLAERLALAGTSAAALAFALWQRHEIGDWFSSMGKLSERASLTPDNLWAWALLAAAVGTLSLLGGVAVYLAAKQD